jgi:hypothetical protein
VCLSAWQFLLFLQIWSERRCIFIPAVLNTQHLCVTTAKGCVTQHPTDKTAGYFLISTHSKKRYNRNWFLFIYKPIKEKWQNDIENRSRKTFFMPYAMNVTTFLQKYRSITFTYVTAICLNELRKKEMVQLKNKTGEYSHVLLHKTYLQAIT